MFIPNNKGLLSRPTGTNAFGEKSYGTAVQVACGVVHLGNTAQKTSVRTDQSATRGNADEFVSAAKILFLPAVNPTIGDKFQIAGKMLRLKFREERYSVLGDLDHYECDFEGIHDDGEGD